MQILSNQARLKKASGAEEQKRESDSESHMDLLDFA